MTPQARSNLKFPEKAAARRAVRAAIVAGLLKRPDACSKCGAIDTKCSDGRSRIQAHHANGYEEKLNVIWLCPACHALEDARASGDQNGRARITWAEVVEIKRRYVPNAQWCRPEGSCRQLAKEFGVSPRTINRIVKGKGWIDAALKGEAE